MIYANPICHKVTRITARNEAVGPWTSQVVVGALLGAAEANGIYRITVSVNGCRPVHLYIANDGPARWKPWSKAVATNRKYCYEIATAAVCDLIPLLDALMVRQEDGSLAAAVLDHLVEYCNLPPVALKAVENFLGCTRHPNGFREVRRTPKTAEVG